MKIYLAYTRACYSLAVALAIGSAIYSLLNAAADWFASGTVTAGRGSWVSIATCALAFAFIYLGGKALVRSARGRALIANPGDDRQRNYLLLLTLLLTVGHLSAAVVCNAYYVVITQVRDMPGPVAIFIAVACASYLAALWIGELVLAAQTHPSTTPTSSDSVGR